MGSDWVPVEPGGGSNGLGLYGHVAEARAVMVQLLRQMTPERKIERVAALNRMTRGLAMAGLRERHPHASEEELRLRLRPCCLARTWPGRPTDGPRAGGN